MSQITSAMSASSRYRPTGRSKQFSRTQATSGGTSHRPATRSRLGCRSSARLTRQRLSGRSGSRPGAVDRRPNGGRPQCGTDPAFRIPLDWWLGPDAPAIPGTTHSVHQRRRESSTGPGPKLGSATCSPTGPASPGGTASSPPPEAATACDEAQDFLGTNPSGCRALTIRNMPAVRRVRARWPRPSARGGPQCLVRYPMCVRRSR